MNEKRAAGLPSLSRRRRNESWSHGGGAIAVREHNLMLVILKNNECVFFPVQLLSDILTHNTLVFTSKKIFFSIVVLCVSIINFSTFF